MCTFAQFCWLSFFVLSPTLLVARGPCRHVFLFVLVSKTSSIIFAKNCQLSLTHLGLHQALCLCFVVGFPKTANCLYLYFTHLGLSRALQAKTDQTHWKLLPVLYTLTFLLKLPINFFSIFTHLGLSQALCLLFVVFLLKTASRHFLYFHPPWFEKALCLLFVVFLLKTASRHFFYFHPPWFETGPALLVLCTFTLLSKLPVIICSFLKTASCPFLYFVLWSLW